MKTNAKNTVKPFFLTLGLRIDHHIGHQPQYYLVEVYDDRCTTIVFVFILTNTFFSVYPGLQAHIFWTSILIILFGLVHFITDVAHMERVDPFVLFKYKLI